MRNTIEELEPQFRKVLYPLDEVEGVMFTSEEEYLEAVDSGKWTRRPTKSEELPEKDPDEDVNWAEKMKLRRPELPPAKKRDMQKYVSQMNVKNLIKEGKKWGLDFSNYYDLPKRDRPTKLDMRYQIKLAMWRQAGIPLR